MTTESSVRAFAPGRVNLIGEHTDYTDGLVLPMTIHLGTTVTADVGGDRVSLASRNEPEPVDLPRQVPTDPDALAALRPEWARFVGAAIAHVRPARGLHGVVTSTMPIGAGLSSSTSLAMAVTLALGFEGSAHELALTVQSVEQAASGVPCGIMDQLVAAAARPGTALLIDCRSLATEPIRLPGDVQVLVVDSGQPRRLMHSAYAARRAECEAAARIIGPLRDAVPGAERAITDPAVRRRARHVIGENARVRAFAAALAAGDAAEAGQIMTAGHRSLRDDFEVSTPTLDDTVAELMATPGVLGARLTGAGFGGCVVALTRPGVTVASRRHWIVQPAGPAWREQAATSGRAAAPSWPRTPHR